MKKNSGSKYLMIIISLLLSSPRAWADTLEFANGQTMQTERINPQETINNFQYGIIKVNYTSAPITNLKITNEGYKILPDNVFIAQAHASILPLNQNVLTTAYQAHQALQTAIHIKDVEPFLTSKAYKTLTEKVKDGSKEILILQLLKTSIPVQINIIQTHVKDNLAWAVAKGKMYGQNFWGTLTLAREDNTWKLVQETWYGQQGNPIIVKSTQSADEFLNQINDQPTTEFIKWADAAGRPKNSLPLEYGHIRTPKNSFCFFFFLNPEKQKQKDANDLIPKVAAIPSPDMHVVWPSNLHHDPKIYEGNNADGFDVSVAPDKDGYYPNKMNLRLPSGKPREVYIGFLLSF